MTNLHVLQIVEATFAGVGRHVLDLSEGLVQRGVTVDLCYGMERAETAFLDRLPTVGLNRVIAMTGGRSIGRHDIDAWRTVRRAMSDGSYDLIHGHASKAGAVARLAAAGRQPAVVYTPNALVTMSPDGGHSMRTAYGALERTLARMTDAIIYVSPEEEAHAIEVGLRPRTSRIIPNGVGPEPTFDRVDGRNELGLDPNTADEVVIGFVGRLSAQKNVELLLDAYARVRDTTANRSRLIVVGTGEEENAVRSQVERLDLTDHVTLAGYRNGARAMPAFDVFALPSRYEGFPYVLLEALRAGVPCVATTGCSAGLLLGDARAGLLVAPTATAFSEALARLIDAPERRSAMAAAARTRAAQFSVDEMINATHALYQDVVAVATKA
ncbi:MAG: glycosyltransferase family 4 protein [Actinomycetota bacterium]